MRRRDERDRERLVRWLTRNAPRLVTARPGAIEQWSRYRNLLWTAAWKLMQIEEGACDAPD